MPKIELDIKLLIQEYSNYLFKIVNNIAASSLSYQDKEEIISSSFYLLWKNQESIEANPKSYLVSITKNLVYDYLRKKKITYVYDDRVHFVSLEYDNLLIMEEKIKCLTEEEKDIFTLFYVEGYKVREIADIKNKNKTTIKVMLYRIRKKLKEEN